MYEPLVELLFWLPSRELSVDVVLVVLTGLYEPFAELSFWLPLSELSVDVFVRPSVYVLEVLVVVALLAVLPLRASELVCAMAGDVRIAIVLAAR